LTSQAEIILTPAERRHVMALAPTLRHADCCEILAAGLTPHQALWESWERSLTATTAFIDGEVAAMWGMGGSPFSGVGQPWLLTAPAVERVPRAFLEIGRAEVGRMLTICPVLVGIVDGSYRKALRLLAALGYTVGEPFPYGPHGALFRPYRMER
jgi:hypothetical protein